MAFVYYFRPLQGNFLLQKDGTLCVLDFGLMTEVHRVASFIIRALALIVENDTRA